MRPDRRADPRSLLLLLAGAKGAVGSTVAAATVLLKNHADLVLPSLTSAGRFPHLGSPNAVHLAGWDSHPRTLTASLAAHGVVPESLWRPYESALAGLPLLPAPAAGIGIQRCVAQLREDMRRLCDDHPGASPVLVNLLPAAERFDGAGTGDLNQLLALTAADALPDLAYAIAAVQCGIPVVNFTPNTIELPAVVAAANQQGVPLAGRDGKTGQTYFKVVLASALKARRLEVEGWYSLNILGNADGANLMDPAHAAGKLANKTDLLEDVLGYRPGSGYNAPTHKVRIDYYPPRGDAKEAWDVIDFKGLFGMPMSMRVNLQGRDSILAAPLVLDLARWMAALKLAGRKGLVPELGFFFKKPLGEKPPLSFQEQLAALETLARDCDRAAGEAVRRG